MVETSGNGEDMRPELVEQYGSNLQKRGKLWAYFAQFGSSGNGSFNLNRWFLILSFFVIVATSSISTWLVTGFVEATWLRHDGSVMAGLVSGIVRAEQATDHFAASDPNLNNKDLQRLFAHISEIPGVMRTTLYSKKRVILWSSEEGLIGRKFLSNTDLDRALAGQMVIEQGTVGHSTKPEHAFFEGVGQPFIENYIPIFDPSGDAVVGVAEVYRTPRDLIGAIRDSQYLILASTFTAGLILYITLSWIVHRADVRLRHQQAMNTETQALAAVGEMASAVAHGLRNPLASIRTSAELALEDDPPTEFREAFGDIVAQADRLEHWIRELMTSSKLDGFEFELCDLNDLIVASINPYREQATRQDIGLSLELERSLPHIRANRIALSQVVSSLVVNAIEAMTDGGPLRIASTMSEDRERAVISITDLGSGIAPGSEEELLRPFVTTKGRGLGVGLSLAKRIIERHGGSLRLRNAPSHGTIATIDVPIRR